MEKDFIRTKCEECGGKVIRKKIDYIFLGENLGRFFAEVCTRCGEEVFDEAVSAQIEKAIKKKGLWGLESHTKVGKVGNCIDVRITKKVANFLRLKKGREVTTYPESKHKLVIEIP